MPVAPLPDVAAGDVTRSTAVLWARSDALGAGLFEVSADPAFGSILQAIPATVTDPLLPVKVAVSGLPANSALFYRFTDAAGEVEDGRFVTPAGLSDGFQGLSFGVTGDWRGELSPYPAVSNADDAALDWFLTLGDTIYADFPSPAVNQPQAITPEDFLAKHAEVYAERFGLDAWNDLRQSTALFSTIDDHEVTNDFAGGGLIGTTAEDEFRSLFPGDDANAFVNDSTLYDNGLDAFQAYNPVRDDFYADTGADPLMDGERKLYRFETFGQDAASFVLDQRSFRDEQLTAPNITNPAEVGNFLIQSLTQDRSILGDRQFEDLKADLLAAEQDGVTWKFVMTNEPIQNLGIFNPDSWEGYAHERTELMKFIEDNGIDNVVFVAADIHGTFVNNLIYQESVTDILTGTQRASSAWEISTGSVAFDPPFGFSVVDVAAGLGLIDAPTRAFYDSLPIAPDSDDIPNDKDDFLKSAFNSLSIAPAGLDPLGLDTNLAVADGLFDGVTLLQGDYVAAHTFGWTQFDIDEVTQLLTVTTYGIQPYTAADLANDPAGVTARVPQIVSQFTVEAQVNTAPVFQNVDAAITVDTAAVNQRLIRNLDATDADGDTLVWRIEGEDADLLSISPVTGALSFDRPFDGVGGSADGDRVFEIDVLVSDGTAEIRQSVAVTLPEPVDLDPVFTNLPATDAQTPFAVDTTAANQRLILNLDAVDPEGEALVFSIAGGEDAGLFNISGTTGSLYTRSAPFASLAADAGNDGVYQVQVAVTATDGSQAVEDFFFTFV